jgi:hypothetical protein
LDPIDFYSLHLRNRKFIASAYAGIYRNIIEIGTEDSFFVILIDYEGQRTISPTENVHIRTNIAATR